jgi:hypothetical protein
MKKIAFVTGALVGGLAAASASSATLAFSLDVSNEFTVPTFMLTNLSKLKLTDFNLTIGDRSFNFDAGRIVTAPSGGTTTLNTPDTNFSGGLRSENINLSFTDFGTNDFARFDVDPDLDHRDTIEDIRGVLFNNGSAQNAIATATFSGGRELSLTLPDGPYQTSYSFSALETTVVPAPAALPLLAGTLGLAGIFAYRRRA